MPPPDRVPVPRARSRCERRANSPRRRSARARARPPRPRHRPQTRPAYTSPREVCARGLGGRPARGGSPRARRRSPPPATSAGRRLLRCEGRAGSLRPRPRDGSSLDPIRPDERGQAPERLVEIDRTRALLPPHPLHAQRPVAPVEDRLDAPHEPVALEDREDVVAVLALRRRDVHLEPVEEIPEGLGPVAVVNQPVERRQERDAVGRRAVLGVGMREEPASVEAHAERAKASFLVQAPRLRQRQRLGLGIPAVGEIPDALLAPPADDGDLAARREALEHQAHLPLAPPGVLLALVARRVLDLAREKGPALAQLFEDVAAEGGVLPQPLDDPQVERPVAPAHERLQDREILDRVEERVPFDELPFLPEQAVDLAGVPRSESAPEDEMLRRRDRRDRVEL